MKILTSKLNIVFLVLMFGCTAKRESGYRQSKEIYINQFKLVYAKNLLKKTYNNTEAINSILMEDKSGFSESVLAEVDYKFIDSITTAEKNFLQADSIKNLDKAEGSDGKHIFDFLIRKIENRALNKLAEKRYGLAKKY